MVLCLAPGLEVATEVVGPSGRVDAGVEEWGREGEGLEGRGL